MKKRGRWWVAGLVSVAVAAAAFFLVARTRAPAPQRTLVERVAAGRFTREVSGTGVVAATEERTLTFGSAGTVQSVFVREGDRVEAGTVLATLDTAALERDLASSRAGLQSARADLERLNAQQQVDRIDTQTSVASAADAAANAQETLSDAQNTLSTTQRLFDTGAASQNDLSTAQAARDSAQRRLESATLTLQSAQTRQGSFGQLGAAQRSSAAAQVASLETTVANLEQTLQETSLVAPFAGTVAAVGFKTGDTVGVAAGASLRLVDTSSLYVKADFDENRAGELAVGQQAVITPDANAEARLAATVRRLGAVAVRTNNAAQLNVDLDFVDLDFVDPDFDAADLEDPNLASPDLVDPEPDKPNSGSSNPNSPTSGGPSFEAAGLEVRPGYTVTARVTVNAVEDALLVPLEAITEEDNESFVYKVAESEPGRGVVTRAAVRVLDRNATVAAAASDVLNKGDLIAVIDLDELAAGAAVAFDPLAVNP